MKKFTVFFQKKRSAIIFIIISLMIPLYTILAENMQSSTYKITSDTVNVGGVDSSSPNYKLGDTAGEAGTGDSSSSNYALHAGFWQMQESYISISNPSDLNMTPIGGINGEASEGTMSWQVVTDNSAGYSLNIKSNTSPALTSGTDYFSDYTPSGANPDYNFSINPSTSAFGFSPEGIDTSARYKDNGAACNTGTGETTGKCWDGLSTTAKTIAEKMTNNQPTGSTVTVRFRAESGANHIQPAGNYTAPIIVTAVTL
jgi:hypothetical protein